VKSIKGGDFATIASQACDSREAVFLSRGICEPLKTADLEDPEGPCSCVSPAARLSVTLQMWEDAPLSCSELHLVAWARRKAAYGPGALRTLPGGSCLEPAQDPISKITRAKWT
jgi:hypothetical protein